MRARLVAAGHRHVLGWVDDMPVLIRACHVVVQNAGGLTVAEALVSAVPVLTYRCLPGAGGATIRAGPHDAVFADAFMALLPDVPRADVRPTC